MNPGIFLVSIFVATTLAGCATNPVTGEQDLSLMSEQGELALGKKNHPKILKQFGSYDDSALQAYVNRVGQSLVTRSHRSKLAYTFTVLDSADVNAFALPGGYIYITRGIMAYINSEAELAAVLGHELGHVTARHGVQQYSKALATGIGMTLATIFVPELRNDVSQQLMNILGNAMLSGYGREDELEADSLGAEYLARAGYDPGAMIDVISILKNQEMFEKERAEKEGREPRVYHGVFASHPTADKRLQQVVSAANRFKTNGGKPGRVNRDLYLTKLNGVIFGDSVREGIRRENRFYHASLGFALTFPKGWRIENRSDRLFAFSKKRDAVIEVRMKPLDKKKTIPPAIFLREKLKVREPRDEITLTKSKLQNVSAITRGRTPFGRRDLRISVVYFGDNSYVFRGAARDNKRLQDFDAQFRNNAASLHALTPAEKKLAAGLVIRIRTLKKAGKFAKIAKSSPIPNYPERILRLINDKYPQGEPKAGEKIKLIQ
ncbi:MAG: M48 family metalloprotease [Acidiferrobacterales bacterium]